MRPWRLSRVNRWLLAAAAAGVAGAALEIRFVELTDIKVVQSVESLAALPPGAPDVVLVHISDVHIGSLGEREGRAIEIINASHPDLIVLSGDLVHGPGHPGDLETFLTALHARYGKFLVWGNHDYWSNLPGTWGPEVVRRSGFTLLRNESVPVEYPGGTIVISGLDDMITARDNLARTMKHVSKSDACILISHTPEIAHTLGPWDIDLVLAGHSHGGQIRLPLVGALIVPFGTRDYVEGWFDVPPRARLHVSVGLGWSYVPIRFLCRPTIDVITLRAAARNDLRGAGL